MPETPGQFRYSDAIAPRDVHKNRHLSSAVPLSEEVTRIVRASGLPWLRIDLEFPYEAMYQEALAIAEDFVPNRNPGCKGYSGVCLHGLGADKIESHQHFGYQHEEDAPYQWTEAADRCPVTVAFFKDVWPFARYNRVRLLKLDPGGFLAPHRDYNDHHLGPFNFALNNPPGVIYEMERWGMIPFAAGRVFMLDIGNYQSVANTGSVPRIHLICHGVWGPGTQPLIERSYELATREVRR